MSASLVGSEMCIRDRLSSWCPGCLGAAEKCLKLFEVARGVFAAWGQEESAYSCQKLLLVTWLLGGSRRVLGTA
eukprot:14975684-Alexandrium_andersonii.AAC.1